MITSWRNIMEKISILSTPIDFDKTDFFSLLSLSVGYAISKQTAMGELVIGDSGWNVDLRNGEISFGDNKFPCGILGSESYVSNTWLWGWAHTESGLPENAAAPSRRAKRTLSDCPEFTTAKFELDEIHTGHNLSMVAMGTSEKNVCYYRCPYTDGALFVQIENLPDQVFEPLQLREIASRFMEILGGFYCDHRLLAAGLLHTNGCKFNEENNGIAGAIVCEQDGMTLRFDFENVDGLWRTTNVQLG